MVIETYFPTVGVLLQRSIPNRLFKLSFMSQRAFEEKFDMEARWLDKTGCWYRRRGYTVYSDRDGRL